MTKVIILGQEPKEEKKKPIEFVKCLMSDCETMNDGVLSKPSEFDFIELVSSKDGEYSVYNFDIIFAYSSGRRNEGVLFFGHFNDGVVE